jgi:hypothetical protein
MKKNLIFFLVNFATSLLAQDKNQIHKAIVWRGFDHQWTYNHRINRIGSMVFMNDKGTYTGKHYSASGAGRDSTTFRQYYTIVESQNLFFFQGNHQITVTGKEAKLLTNRDKIILKLPKEFQNCSQAEVILNGFELKSIRRSDKPVHFQIHTSNLVFDSVHHCAEFEVQADWVGNCETMECAMFSNKTEYEINIPYLIIGYRGNQTELELLSETESYHWTKKKEYQPTPIEKTIQNIDSNLDYFIAFKSLSFTVNEEQWMQHLRFSIEIVDRIRLSITMLFLDWKEGMKKYAVKKSSKFLSSKKSGWVTMHSDILTIKTRNATISHREHSGEMYWKGRNKSAENTNSESIFELR